MTSKTNEISCDIEFKPRNFEWDYKQFIICKKCNALWNRDENSARNIYRFCEE